MSSLHVHAQLGEDMVEIGELHVHRTRGAVVGSTFVYAPAWAARPDGFDLDPAVPRGAGPVQTPQDHALPRALADCTPDRWGRTLRKREERRLAEEEDRTARSLDELDFLVGVRNDLRQGDLRIVVDGVVQREGGDIPVLAQLPELLELSQRAQDDEITAAELAKLVRQGSSLGGARPKAHVRDLEGRIGIAKFPSAAQDTWDVMAWEKVCLDLAEAAGIEAPVRQLLRVAGRHVLVVARFDRVHRPGIEPLRVGYRSAMTMCERTDGDAGSYLEIAEAIEERSPRATQDLQQLWRRIAFNVLVTNTDDHLRNHAFLHVDADAWHLAPAFDLNPNPEAADAPHLHTAIDEYATDADVDLLMEVASHFRLTGDRPREVLREVGAAVAEWREVARSAGLDERAVRAMSPAFDHDRLRAARG